MRREAGFTLIEILLAIAILAIVLAMVYASFDQTSTLAAHVEEVSEEYQGARIAFVKLNAELNSAYGGLADGEDSGFVGVDTLGPDGLDADGLAFATLARATLEGRPGSYHASVTYRVEGDKLLHREVPAEAEPGAVPPPEWPLVEGIAGFRLRYLTKAGDWKDAWGGDEGEGNMPRAVEVTLFFPAKGAEGDADRDGYMALKEIVRVPMGTG